MGTITLDRVIFEIYADELAESPRAWDNMGTLLCWHRRYQLGDRHDYPTPQDFERAIPVKSRITLPVFLFDHSGLTLSISSAKFRAVDPAGWDWGQVGWIYATNADIRREYSVRHMSRRVQERVLDVLCGEVETYNQYMNGEVYGFTITDRASGDVLDACAGFYGENPWTNGMADHLPTPYREEVLSYFHRGAA
jgi:hypothetical protein